ncbi:MAG TPA: YdcF family protein [Stellaceae bacterium]|nr:YdcF family protein [Stellaceae bacterium]
MGALGMLAITLLPVGDLLAGMLESRVSPRPLPPRIDGIIVLGGGVDTELSAQYGRVELTPAGSRITAAIGLAYRFPEAKIALIGGSGRLLEAGDPSEASVMGQAFIEAGIDPHRLVLEETSRNTYENAVETQKLLHPGRAEQWLLVTSAMHMPRAIGCFRHVGLEPLPYPVDFKSHRSLRPRDITLGENLVLLDYGVREWIGLIAYRLLGRIDSLWPA